MPETWKDQLNLLSRVNPKYLCLLTTVRGMLSYKIGGKGGLILNHITLDFLKFTQHNPFYSREFTTTNQASSAKLK